MINCLDGFEDRNIIRDSLIRLFSLCNKSNSIELEKTRKEIKARENGKLFLAETNKAFPQYVMLGKTWYREDVFKGTPLANLLKCLPCNDKRVQLPLYMDLLNNSNIFVEYDENNISECQKFTHNIIWSFLSEIPVSMLNISIFDCERRGGSITPFLEFRKNAPDVFDEKIYTDRESVNSRLKRFIDEIDDRIQSKLGRQFQSIIEYNRNNPTQGEIIHLLVVNDFPSGFSSESVTDLIKILKNGSKCGIYTVINYNCNIKYNDYERIESCIDLIKENSDSFAIKDQKCYNCNFDSPIESDIVISESAAKDFATSYVSKIKSINNSSLSIRKVLDNSLFERSSKDKLEIPIGVEDGGERIQLTFGKGSSHHALIAGATGSGKSSLLHTIIISAMLHYKPDELNLYLMDFKSGTEFKIYENFRLPHIKLLAIDAMQEFGESILINLVNEMTDRSEKFKSVGATNLGEYVRTTGKAMPRVLIVMDEFQILYNESQNRKVANNCAELTKRIVTEGRSYGIHLIMATQSTAIISELSLSSGIIEQMRVRIGMKCGENDSRYLFKDNSTKALDMMKGSVGTAVMNPEYTEKDNVRFRVAFCDDDFKNNCLKVIEEEFYSSEYTMQTFEGKRVKTLLSQFKANNDTTESSANVSVGIAEMIKVAPPLRLVFDKKRKHNVLICGSGEKMSNNLFNVLMLGILKNNTSKVYCMDGDVFVDEESFMPFYRQYERFDGQFRLAQNNNDIADFVNEIYDSFIQRKKAKESTTIFVALRNFQYIDLCKKLLKGEYSDESEYVDISEPVQENHSDDFFDFGVSSTASSSDGLSAKFSKLLNEGSAFGIHFIISSTDFQAVKENMYYGENILTKFMDRFIFDLNDNDAGTLIDGVSLTSLNDNTVYYSDGVKIACQVKPYLFPSVDELKDYIDNGMNDALLSQNEENVRREKPDNTNGLSAIERLKALCGDDRNSVCQTAQDAECENQGEKISVGATLYLLGIGVHQDEKVAFELYNKAADAGSISAMHNLGVMCYNGQGVQRDYKAAFGWFHKAAELGQANSFKPLGMMYYNGQGVQQDFQSAYKWCQKAADLGDADAMYYIGLMFYNGQGVQQDYQSAYKWHQKAADLGHSIAMFLLGNMFYEGKGVQRDYKCAFDWTKKAADLGVKEAMLLVGNMYYDGQGIQQDYNAAYKWHRKAADLGDSDAMFKLGEQFYEGQGVHQDYKTAFNWYKKAADLGNSYAMNRLGLMCKEGKGVQQDYSSAVEWYQKAMELKNYESSFDLGEILYDAQEYETAFSFYKLAATFGNGEAMNKLGLMFYNGLGVEQNYQSAIEFFQNAAKVGNISAMSSLGDIYYDGRGVQQDYQTASLWYNKAADLGDSGSMYTLGIMNEKGTGVQKNYTSAYVWYNKAAELGNAGAMYNLGLMYDNGRGVQQDYVLANKWYNKAADLGDSDAMSQLGEKYYKGQGVQQDYNLAFRYLDKAAKLGNNKAFFNLGLMYYNARGVQKDFKLAFQYFEKASKSGDRRAYIYLGSMYCDGCGVGQDFNSALVWYKKAAESGSSMAMNNLANMYHNGQGVQKDDKSAFAWYKKAAESGEIAAMNNLANMYYKGYGVQQDYESAFVWYKKAADLGERNAISKLGKIYYKGQGVTQDYESAFRWIKKAADFGDSDAMSQLGVMYYKGQGVQQDYKSAFQYLDKAAKLGDNKAYFYLGILYYDGQVVKQDYKSAFNCFYKSAENGNRTAMYNLGELYYEGQGVQQDFKSAFLWYKKAADLGENNAISKLGKMYYNGQGVPQDYKSAFMWLKKAADLGDNYAISRIGEMYYSGQGVQQDYKSAFHYLDKAAKLGDNKAYFYLGILYYDGQVVKQDYKSAFNCFYKSAETGNRAAMYHVGELYYEGQGVQQDFKSAFLWYKKAADLGDSNAISKLGKMYYNGQGVTQDYKSAFMWLKKAAELGDVDSMYLLGAMYHRGNGVQQDYQSAYKWFEKAANIGNSDAMYALGVVFANGQGVQKDYKSAFEWFKKAADLGHSTAMNNLGEMFYNGQGVSRDYDTAYECYKKAAKLGNAKAKENLLSMQLDFAWDARTGKIYRRPR